MEQHQNIRKICLDTETTGLSFKNGDRIIEIGCVELINDIKTGKTFQHYINPERELSKESEEICGLKSSFFYDKPKFTEVYEDFLNFIKDSVLIIHNATFDINFLNYEFSLLNKEPLRNEVIDTLQVARMKFPGQKVSLDALCKRFEIDNTRRVHHGALLDSELLSDVYIQLIGGIEKELIIEEDKYKKIENEDVFKNLLETIKNKQIKPNRNFSPSIIDLQNHENFIKNKIKNAIWLNIFSSN